MDNKNTLWHNFQLLGLVVLALNGIISFSSRLFERTKVSQKKNVKILETDYDPEEALLSQDLNKPSGYDHIKELGEGAYGVVTLVEQKTNNEKVAMKKIIIRSSMNIDEMKILSTIKHSHILKFVRSFVEGGTLFLITEYCEHGDLSVKIENKKKDKESFTHFQINYWTFQLIEAISFIHSKRIIHRDIKPSNIFLNQDESIKLGDFGVARVFGTTSTTNTTSRQGTTKYMSPQQNSSETYTNKTDCWSTGCVLFELFTLEIFFDKFKSLENDAAISEEIQLIDTQDDFKDILRKMLRIKEEDRTTSNKLKEMLTNKRI